MISEIENLENDIYNSLKDIQREEKVKLENKAFIADFLSQKLHQLGYKKIPTGYHDVKEFYRD